MVANPGSSVLRTWYLLRTAETGSSGRKSVGDLLKNAAVSRLGANKNICRYVRSTPYKVQVHRTYLPTNSLSHLLPQLPRYMLDLSKKLSFRVSFRLN